MQNENIYYTDVLVIGAGIAGVRAANSASRLGARVTVVSKGPCCTGGVIGFNAAVGRDDSADLYYEDLMKSGCALNDTALARTLAVRSAEEVFYLESLGLRFDRNPDGSFHLIQPLGCTVPRLVHLDSHTGAPANRLLVEDSLNRGVSFVSDIMIFDLLETEGKVCGACGINRKTGALSAWIGSAVVLAAGGCGDIYPITTYPAGIIGDGYAMAFRAGAELIDMEFLQFEPCCLTYPEAFRGLGLSTTMMKEGAALKNRSGEAFLSNYFKDGAVIQKGELSRAISSEIASGRGTEHGGIYYDLTQLPEKTRRDHCFFYDALLKSDFNLAVQPAEVAPAAHTCLGGVRVDNTCKSSLEGLYAAGEAIGGLHGANRIGGCAGAETFVFGAVAGESAARHALESVTDFANEHAEAARVIDSYRRRIGSAQAQAADYPSRIRETASKNIGLIRNKDGLAQARDELRLISLALRDAAAPDMKSLSDVIAAQNMAVTASMMAVASHIRTESRGVFFREDYPSIDELNWNCSIALKKCGDGIQTSVTRR